MLKKLEAKISWSALAYWVGAFTPASEIRPVPCTAHLKSTDSSQNLTYLQNDLNHLHGNFRRQAALSLNYIVSANRGSESDKKFIRLFQFAISVGTRNKKKNLGACKPLQALGFRM